MHRLIRTVQALTPRLSSKRQIAVSLVGVLAVLAAFASAQPSGSAQALGLGEENSWIRIQNVGGAPAAADVAFYDLGGQRVGSDGCPKQNACEPIPPGFGWSFFQQAYRELPEGYRGSAFLRVDQPFVALTARDAFKDQRFQIGGDTLRLGAPAASLYLPLVQNRGDYVSRISVQNANGLEACVQVIYWAPGGAQFADPPGPTAGCPNGSWLVPPRGTLLRDERNLPVPGDFDGGAVVRTHDTASGVRAGSQALAATVDTRERNGVALATTRGIAASELSRTVVLPLADRNACEGRAPWTTRFRILNGQPGTANEVELRFEGTDEAGNRYEIDHKMPLTTALTCDQRQNGAAGCLPDDKPLPGTFKGIVRLIATEPIAVVGQRLGFDGSLGDFRGFTVEEASRQVLLPVVNKNFGPFGDAQGWNSWFRVASFDGTPAHVRVLYYSKGLPPNGLLTDPTSISAQVTVRQWEDGRLPDRWVGSAIIIADRPVVVVANLESDVFRGDPVMLYNGVSYQ